MVLNVYRKHKAYSVGSRIREGGTAVGGGGGEGMAVGEREIDHIYISLHRHHQNDSCIKMGRDASHFNVSLTVRGKVKRQRPQTTTFEEKGEPKWI